MSKRIGLLLLLMVFSILANAQDKLTYADVDKRSYELYLENKWTELIALATEAREQGIDFFYLQVRTAIAWYNQGKYRNAVPWFLKAYENNKTLDWLQEYVYYSLLYSGRHAEAAKYAAFFSDTIKNKIRFKETGLARLAYETGYCVNSDYENLKTRDFSTEVNLGNDYGEAYLLKNYSFHSLDLSHRLAPNFLLNHNLTYIGVNRETVVDWSGQTSASVKTNQYQYYINPVWVIGEKLNISPSLNLIFGSGNDYLGGLNNNLAKTFSFRKSKYSDAVFSTSLWSDFGNFSPGFEFNTANVNDSKFTQLSSWVTYYPLSNTKLYVTPQVYFKSGSNGLDWNAIGVTGGAKIGKVFLNVNYLWGNMTNFVESNGYVVTNFPGSTNRKLMLSTYFPVGKKYQFVIRYINQKADEKYQVYTSGIKSNSLEYNYSKNTLTAGISWNF